MRKSKKDKLLEAMETILQEYKRKHHRTACSTCVLCKLYQDEYSDKHECHKCPMFVFHNKHDYPCMDRRCTPVNYVYNSKMSNKYRAVIEFYTLAIEGIQLLNNEDFDKKKTWNFLKTIDNSIADKYNLNIPKKLTKVEVPVDEY
jgi:hypothetical protein